MYDFPRVPRSKTISMLSAKDWVMYFLSLGIYILYCMSAAVAISVVTLCRSLYSVAMNALFSVCSYAQKDPVESAWMDRAFTQAASFEKMLMARLDSTTHKRCIVISSGCQSSQYEFMVGNISAYSMRRADTSSYWHITITLSDAYYSLKEQRDEIVHASKITMVATSDMNYMDERAMPPTVISSTSFNLMELYHSHLEEHIKDINNPIFKEMLTKATN
jgi:hypothetical protein